MRRLVYYVAVTLDGFIAGPEGQTDFFATDAALLADLFGRYPETCPGHVRRALGIDGPARRFDTVIMGGRTHDVAVAAGLASGYPHLRQFVVTGRDFPEVEGLALVRADPVSVVQELKKQDGGDVWLCGGGCLAGQLRDQIDELQLKVYPISFGDGIRLFAGSFDPRPWRQVSSEQLPAGVRLVTFERPT